MSDVTEKFYLAKDGLSMKYQVYFDNIWNRTQNVCTTPCENFVHRSVLEKQTQFHKPVIYVLGKCTSKLKDTFKKVCLYPVSRILHSKNIQDTVSADIFSREFSFVWSTSYLKFYRFHLRTWKENDLVYKRSISATN